MGQMQQRLKTSGFPTPIPPFSNGNARLLSPAFGTGITVGWQTNNSRLTGNLVGLTQMATTAGALNSRPASSALAAYAGPSTGALTVPMSTLHQVPENEYEMGYGKPIRPDETDNPVSPR